MMGIHTIAIIGGGPAGSRSAEILAQAWGLRNGLSGGHRVLVFEEKIGWEKPCGGGLSYKVLRRYPFLGKATGHGKLIHEVEFLAPTDEAMRFRLRLPMAIYSRATLNRLLLRRAEDAGAEIIADRIQRLRRRGLGWELEGRQGNYAADFVVLAAGARTRLRQELVQDFTPRDFMLTFGYYVPMESDLLRVQFYKEFEGYAWAFPRPDHLSVGICGKVGEDRMAGLRDRLKNFMQRFGYVSDKAQVFSHLLPALSTLSWGGLRLAGPGWALAGDSAGLVDPLTGEGIYYALRSGEILAETLVEGLSDSYSERVWEEFGQALSVGARLVGMFYHGNFLGGDVTTRMVEFGARSRGILALMQDLEEGSETYQGLAWRLSRSLASTLLDTGKGLLRDTIGRPARRRFDQAQL
jgi:geranylgeranyl diphosphate/geranylgeranyl-bacteriochlorophyllide a reductase